MGREGQGRVPSRQDIDLAYLNRAYLSGRIEVEQFEQAIGRVLEGEFVFHPPFGGDFEVEWSGSWMRQAQEGRGYFADAGNR